MASYFLSLSLNETDYRSINELNLGVGIGWLYGSSSLLVAALLGCTLFKVVSRKIYLTFIIPIIIPIIFHVSAWLI